MVGNNPVPQDGFYTRCYLVCGHCSGNIHGLIKKGKKITLGKVDRKAMHPTFHKC